MKVMAFNARPDERAFFDHFSQSLDMDLTLQKDTLTLDNVALTRGYDGISCTCDLPAPILEKLAENGVRYVALRTIGYDNVDLKAAERLGIRVSHAGYSPYAVSNYTVMLMLMCIRKAGYIMFRSHTADYSLGASGAARGMEMQNLTVGVIGTGRIGKAVIHNLSGFGCRIIAHDPYPSEEMKQMGVEYVSLESLYGAVRCHHAAHLPQQQHLPYDQHRCYSADEAGCCHHQLRTRRTDRHPCSDRRH